ncbi:hypothetical protein T4E_5023 [Trichinella pseudospiralis]|uniref:WAP domain-containing protein n=1 Tax=Trichinella pseudospiralis TaxID=6337 RepID=A0A0V0Y737_TRIPS|nr:hypothetical protein T4E_5023 [Trichinella pseudospiralis]
MNFNTPSGAYAQMILMLLPCVVLMLTVSENFTASMDNAVQLPKGNCADGTPSPAKCSEMKNCPPNHACHRGQCCSLFTNKRKTSLCPDGTPTSIRCNEKNRCDTGAECMHGFCCSKVHAPPAKQGRCPILLVNLRTRSTVQPKDQCFSDVHCESIQKRCLTFAGKRCLLPETDFGQCADGSPAESVCNIDEQSRKKSQSCVHGICCNTAAHANKKNKKSNRYRIFMSPFRHIHPSRFNLPANVQWTLIATFKTMLLNIYWPEMLNIAR